MPYTRCIATKTILLAAVLIAASGFAFGQDQPSSGSDQFVFVGAGDIANCDLLGGARATAGLLDGIAGTVFTLGDHAYAKGDRRRVQPLLRANLGAPQGSHSPDARQPRLPDRPRPSLLRVFRRRRWIGPTGLLQLRAGRLAHHLVEQLVAAKSARTDEMAARGPRCARSRLRTRLLACPRFQLGSPHSGSDHAPHLVNPVQGRRGCCAQRARSHLRTVRASRRQGETRCRARHPAVHRRHRGRWCVQAWQDRPNSEVHSNTGTAC